MIQLNIKWELKKIEYKKYIRNESKELRESIKHPGTQLLVIVVALGCGIPLLMTLFYGIYFHFSR